MNSFKKIASVVLALTLSATMLTGCAKSGDKGALTKLVVDTKTVSVPYIAKIDDQKVSLDQYGYYFLSLKRQYEKGDSSIWASQPEMEETLKENALKYIKEGYAIKNLAKENGIEVNDEIKAEVDKKVAEMETQYGGKKGYTVNMNAMNCSDEIYRDFVENGILFQKLYDKFYGESGEKKLTEDEEKKLIAENYVRASHVLIKLDTDGTTTKQDLAKDILARAKNGEDFNALIAQYGEDPGMKSQEDPTKVNEDGYYFTHKQMVPEFEEAAFAMKENEISDIVKTTHGYHIIKKLPMEQSYITENFETMMQTYYQEELGKMLEQSTAKLKVELSDQYESISTSTLLPTEKVIKAQKDAQSMAAAAAASNNTPSASK